MPTIGWFEILIVVTIAIIVLGPKDFPIMLKKVGSWIGTTKKYIKFHIVGEKVIYWESQAVNFPVKKE